MPVVPTPPVGPSGLIDVPSLLAVADRAATQYQILQTAFAQLTQMGAAYYWQIVQATNNPDVEVPCYTPYYFVDTSMNVAQAVRNGTPLATIIGAMDAHFNIRDVLGNPLQVGGWDGYLSTHGAEVSYYFAQLYFAVLNTYMQAINVFSEGDDIFGTVDVAAGPVIAFTDGINYGTGSALNPANGLNYAATQLKVYVQNMGPAAIDLRLSVKDVNNLPTTIDVTVPGGQPSGTTVLIGTGSNRYLDVMGVSYVPAGSTGTVGDQYTIRNKKLRQIAL